MANLPYGRDSISSQGRVLEYETTRSYYSGADVAFEFEDIPVDDIAYITYEVIEPVKLHYGYASRYRLRTSRGTRMVSGQFAINFKDSTYILDLLKKIKDGSFPGQKNDDYTALDNSVLASQVAANKLNKSQAQQNLFSNKTSIANKVYKPSKERLEAYRDALWGTSNPTSNTKADNLYNERVKANTSLPLDKDLFITEYLNGKKNPGSGSNSKFESKPGGFNIKMIFGEPGGFGFYEGANQPSSDQVGRQIGIVKVINGVEIMSEGMEISETGEAIRLNYRFTAADVY